MAACAQVREKAQEAAQQLKEGSEQRLVKQLAAQRRVLEKDMRQTQSEMKKQAMG